ncbi:dTDP-4-dehydrorhamnose 3,5-epimerase [Planctomycetaceae bacterium SCGC AG-212-F19]|nr:dTDP-4-dehydrorhamnose 3,5-epimerase [Planctomycetaceae bacterium SCGC AG-212-F19]
MIFTATKLPGVFTIEPERREDERGFFARTWCRQEFLQHGLNADLAQCSITFTRQKSTLRGMHYQAPPHAETKLVRCTRGAIYDVALDLRPDSPTFRAWFATELTAGNRRMVYLPPGIAHGLQTLEENTEVLYQISEVYYPEAARGVRWNDPAFGIAWPLSQPLLSDRDQAFPDFQP